jgi:oligopeptidase B
MNRRELFRTGAAFALLAAFGGCGAPPPVVAPPVAPVAKRIPKTIEQLGRTRTDAYAWMKDERWQDVLLDPSLLRADIREHLEAENLYFDGMMAGAASLRDKLFEEMKGRVKEDDSTLPQADGPWRYLRRFEAGGQHPVFIRQTRSGEGVETVLLDANERAAGKAFFRIAAARHSPDHTLFAWAEDTVGSESYTLVIRDIATGAVSPSPIEDAYGGFAFSPDSRFLFWVHRDQNGRPSKIMRRPVRGGEADVVEVFAETDAGKFLDVSVSASGAFIEIVSADGETSEYRYIPAGAPESVPIVFAPRQTGELYYPVDFDDRWYILTNAGGAVDFKIAIAERGQTDRASWRDIVPHEPGRYIEQVIAFRDRLVRIERSEALPRIVIRERSDGSEHAIEQTEAAFALSLESGLEYDARLLRFVYQSPTTPRTWYDYDMQTRKAEVRKTQEVPSGHDPTRYRVERFRARAPDGALVPVTVLRLADREPDASAPLLLYGYGSYGYPTEAAFDTRVFSLVDRGWVWAYAHVRGGSDLGWDWFQQGRKSRKMNSFTDFIAVAENLVSRGYVRKGRIVGMGRSAGGLLVGGAMIFAPDGLFGGFVAGVPFVDALNTMSDASLPLTPTEWPEWGDPLTDPQAYDDIAAYSPYDNIADRPYPPVLATGGLTDPRVTYWEPAKFIARLREVAGSGGPYVLSMNMTAGHSGAGGRFDRLKDDARDYAFAIKALGEAEAGGAFAR